MTNLVNMMQASAAATNQAIEKMNANGNGLRNHQADGGPMTLVTFLKVDPPTFKGTMNPTKADNWFQAMERALQAQHVPGNQYVEFATYKFEGEAQFWWLRARHLLKHGDVVVTWDAFRVEFYKKYFLNLVRAAKELELLQLNQGSMTWQNTLIRLSSYVGSQWFVKVLHRGMRSGSVLSTRVDFGVKL
ncbi:hypothetical protein AHAS_Ahas19G0180100 [Arachis hypogaea]